MDYVLTIITLIFIFFILTESYNLVLGYTGIVHVGHVAFMAMGAYTTALLTTNGLPFWVGVISGAAVAGIAGLLLGIPTVRFRDEYLVAVTLGMGEIVRLILLNERTYTGGSTGIPYIHRPSFMGVSFNNNWLFCALVAVITIVVLLLVHRIITSPFGMSLKSIREDEIAAQSLGKNVALKKLQILVIGAALAGLAGALYAHTTQFIDPNAFNIDRMLFVFLIVMFGGSGTFLGPIVGTTILFTIFESMRFLPLAPEVLGPLRWMLYSGILIVMIIFKPTGIMGSKLIRKKL